MKLRRHDPPPRHRAIAANAELVNYQIVYTNKVIEYRFMDGWDVVNFEPLAYRKNVRGCFTLEVSAAMWRDCYRIVRGELEELTEGCVDDLQELARPARSRFSSATRSGIPLVQSMLS